jgi:hypothetical protein
MYNKCITNPKLDCECSYLRCINKYTKPSASIKMKKKAPKDKKELKKYILDNRY